MRFGPGVNRCLILWLTGLLAAAGLMWYLCKRSEDIPFLTTKSGGEWIIYPCPPDADSHPAVGLNALFKRSFTLAAAPAQAQLSWRAFTQGTVRINGNLVPAGKGNGVDWKQTRYVRGDVSTRRVGAPGLPESVGRVPSSGVVTNDAPIREVSKLLQPGQNEISVSVSNAFGPPALWLALECDGASVGSDEQWEVSLAGAEWQRAVLASAVPTIRAGSSLYGKDQLIGPASGWKSLAIILTAVSGLVAGFALVSSRRRGSKVGSGEVRRSPSPRPSPPGSGGTNGPRQCAPTGSEDREAGASSPLSLGKRAGVRASLLSGSMTAGMAPVFAFLLIALAWLALFCHNLPLLPSKFGFDRDGHLDYVQYVIDHKALPLADDGWQMYQPPLYYLLAAAIIGPTGISATSDAAVLTLRALTALTAFANLGMVFLCLRLVFPTQRWGQVAGLLLAAFLPANLCLSHHVTNEPLAALFVTAGLYFCLRILRTQYLVTEGNATEPAMANRGSLTPALSPSEGERESAPASGRTRSLPPLPLRGGEGRGEGARWEYLAVGACLGLALLTKFSALLAVPVGLGVLGWGNWKNTRLHPNPHPQEMENGRPPHQSRLRLFQPVLLVLVSMLAVCGWHYARVWMHFGKPIVGNWDRGLPQAWWQEPGYHTGSWFWRCGHALVSPLFGGVNGFWDGLYSTLWGDGLCSGSARIAFHPPWNYGMAQAGYWLALPMSAALLVGVALALARMGRGSTECWSAGMSGSSALKHSTVPAPRGQLFSTTPKVLGLLVGVLCSFGLGIVLMALRLPSYAQVKAFYALPALMPLTALAALGWEGIAKRSVIARCLSVVLLLSWAAMVYASFWIVPNQLDLWIARGIGLADQARFEQAADAFSHALLLNPKSIPARVRLADALFQAGRGQEAHEQATKALEAAPNDAEALVEAAVTAGQPGEEAATRLRRAIELAPDHATAYKQRAVCYGALNRRAELVQACRQALRVAPFDADLHHWLGEAAAASGDLATASEQLDVALALRPDTGEEFKAAQLLQRAGNPRGAATHYRRALARQQDMVEALNNLGWILATSPDESLRNGAEAVQYAQRACELTQRRDPLLLGTLAAAYAEAGRFDEAVRSADQARAIAKELGLGAVASKNEQLLELYRAGKPYREGTEQKN